MSFLQPLMLAALPLIALPILIHLINQWRYQTKPWGAMMFLLAANRMNRGFARIRQWLILAARTLAVAGLIFAIARPLASGLLGMSGGGQTDTTIVLLDRSPSMQQQGTGGASKLETGRRQLASALETLGSKHWVTVDATSGKAAAFESLAGMLDSTAFQVSSATANLPKMLESALDYLKTNKPGPTEVWICSDLREADWNADSGTWEVTREGFEQLPQSVRFHLLAYPQPANDNLSIRVTDARREVVTADAETNDSLNGNTLLLSMQLSRAADESNSERIKVPVQIEIEGARSEHLVELAGGGSEIKNHRVSLPANMNRGWGRVSIPADKNNADNEYFFVFDDPPTRRVVIVSEDRVATRAVEIAAAVSPDGSANSVVEVLAPEQLDSLALDDAALLIWQTALPNASTTPAIDHYLQTGGQVMFLPPTSLVTGAGAGGNSFHGVSWTSWNGEQKTVENWRRDQDLLVDTKSGNGLPVGQLELSGYAQLNSQSPLTRLAWLSGGDPLLARVPTARGGIYFCTASVSPNASSLAESGIVLFVAIQRAIERGQEALGNTSDRIAGEPTEPTDAWRQLAGSTDAVSTEYASQAGIYQADDRLFAVNRALVEDRRDVLADERVDNLFAGLPFARVDDQAGNLSGIVREIWRLFLIAMIIALLVEAMLCLPRPARTVATI
ncbi:MAG: BatA domain-containing protein [Pirellulaceae bacterium]